MEDNKTELRNDMLELARRLIPTIGDEYRAHEESEEPSMAVTVGCECPSADSMSWNYQTGDISFSGGAYLFEFWGSADLHRDTKPEDFADEVISSLEENDDFNWGHNT